MYFHTRRRLTKFCSVDGEHGNYMEVEAMRMDGGSALRSSSSQQSAYKGRQTNDLHQELRSIMAKATPI